MRFHAQHGWQGAVQRLPGRVARTVLVRLAPRQNRADALPDAPGRLLPDTPDWLHDRQHIAPANLVHPYVTDEAKGVAFQGLPPRLRVMAVAPSRQVRFVDPFCGDPERQDVCPPTGSRPATTSTLLVTAFTPSSASPVAG